MADRPVQLIVATRDHYVTPRLADDVARWAADLPHRPRRGPWSPRTHPDAVAERITDTSTVHERPQPPPVARGATVMTATLLLAQDVERNHEFSPAGSASTTPPPRALRPRRPAHLPRANVLHLLLPAGERLFSRSSAKPSRWWRTTAAPRREGVHRPGGHPFPRPRLVLDHLRLMGSTTGVHGRVEWVFRARRTMWSWLPRGPLPARPALPPVPARGRSPPSSTSPR